MTEEQMAERIERETTELFAQLADDCAGKNVAIVWGAVLNLVGQTLMVMGEGIPAEPYAQAVQQLHDVPHKVDEYRKKPTTH